jgi:hypothetical protein
MKNKYLYTLIIILSVGFFSQLNAQPAGGPPPGPSGGGPSGGGLPPCWPPPCIPVDGGITFLIAIGAAYGSKKAFDRYKEKSTNA